MTTRLRLDEMLTATIATQLTGRGYDVLALVADPTLVGMADPDVLRYATSEGRALVTRNVKDFVVLGAREEPGGHLHPGLVLVSTRTFPEDGEAIGALVRSLDALLSTGGVEPGASVFLRR